MQGDTERVPISTDEVLYGACFKAAFAAVAFTALTASGVRGVVLLENETTLTLHGSGFTNAWLSFGTVKVTAPARSD